MSFIDDMSIGKKLIGGFLIVVLILVVVAAIGYTRMGEIDAADTGLYENSLVPSVGYAKMDAAVWTIRGNVYKAMLYESDRETQLKGAETAITTFEEQLDRVKATDLSKEEAQNIKEIETQWAIFKPEVTKMIGFIRKGDVRTAQPLWDSGTPLSNSRSALTKSLGANLVLMETEGKDTADANTALYQSSAMIMIIATIIGVIFALAIGLYLSKSITGPVQQVAEALKELKKGHLGMRLKLNRKDEIGQMAKTMDSFADGQQKWIVGTMQKIAAGDLTTNLKVADDKDEVVPALMTITNSLRALVADANMLSKAAVEGKLDTRADASKHKGDYQKIVKGVNDTLDSVIGPLNVAAEYVDRISKGDMPAKITDQYNGDFNEIKNNLNNCIDNINALVADAEMLRKAAVDGKLATRADATKHQGDYRKIVQGVDDCLDAVIGPLNVAADYVDKISKGNLPQKITDPYNGDFNVIKNNLNNCIDNINALVTDATMLEKAAIEGKLATRADAAKHQGDYKKIVVGVNNCLDSVIGPLNVAADYVDKISKGAIPQKITDPYNGDFNVIKNNLNNCIDNINALVTDANMLAKAAVEGKLDTRADASKHQGDYRKVVDGVNSTLDSVIGPLNVAAEYVDRISKGDMPAKITDQYNGDFNEIKNNLNNCIDNINALVADANMLAKAADEGKLKTRADASKHQGDYQKIVKGVNATLDSVIEPVNEALRVSKGYAAQDFTTRVDPNLKVPGDWLAFKEALNNIGVAVSNAITNINTQVSDLAASAEEANASVEEVSAGAAQVAKNTSAVSVNAEKSMSGIEQVQKAMEDLSHTIQEVATRADATAKLVQDTTVFSKEGMELAQKTENGMQGITKSSNEVNTIILEIKGQMDKISEIVNLITDLANQTNLLALNAAIEAARAGDAGRGFAVVATEVKSLAVESRASAEKIAEMINNLQSQTNNAVDAVTAANNGVKEGSEALHDTLSSFSKIVTSIDQISKNVSDVAAASEEQAASVEEVTASVNEVNGLMQSTSKESTDAAAASEESAAAIDQISKVIGNVNNIVDKVTKEVSQFKC